jgi:F-type H+-transporting ATPase subunit delta
MLLKSLASTYAEALMGNLEPEQYAEAYEDIVTFTALYAQEPRIKMLLDNPAIHGDDRSKLVLSIADRGGFLEVSKSFLLLVLEKDRMGILSDVADRFQELIREREGRELANVTSAVELSPEQVERLRAKLSDYVKKNVEISVTVDPTLIGGMVIRVGNRIMDSSMVNVLSNLKESLIEGS